MQTLNSVNGAAGSQWLVPICRSYVAANPVVCANGASVVLPFDSDTFQRGNIRAPGSNRFIVPVDGLYLINCGAMFVANTVGVRTLQPFMNVAGSGGLVTFALAQINPVQEIGFTTPIQISTVVIAHAGDSIGVAVSQDSGGNLNLQTALIPSFANYCELIYLGAIY